MLRSNRILTLDVGASKVVLAEFQAERGSPPQLLRYGIEHLSIDPDNDAHSSAILVATLRDLLRETAIKPAPLYMSISGQAVFPRYVKLPPVTRDKLYQIVRYEAEQNVPFPINEVVWDYQLLGGESASETNVLLVAVKVESVTRLTDCVQATHLEPEVVDAAPMALHNAVSFNYPAVEGCTMLLDIGARSANLIFVEEHRVFTRSVPVAGNAITQEIAKQFELDFDEAEALKKRCAQVDLGGTYEGPADETGQQVAKIVRNVMTRLHAEVNRSVNFYRSQQGGSSPARVFLAGGTSVMPYTDVFFRDKLGVEVSYLNPFERVPVSPAIDEERISGDVTLLGEVVGLALRYANACPIEINLMPPDLVALKTFRKRQPFFAAAAVAVVCSLLAFWGLSRRAQATLSGQLEVVNERLGALQVVQHRLDDAMAARNDAARRAGDIADVIERRTQWLGILGALHDALLPGMWITEVTPEINVPDGVCAQLRVSGKGFEDRLARLDNSNATAIEQYRDRLRLETEFAQKTDIIATPPSPPGDIRRSFTLRIELSSPITMRDISP